MARKSLSIVALVLMVILFAGCGKSSSSTPSAAIEPTIAHIVPSATLSAPTSTQAPLPTPTFTSTPTATTTPTPTPPPVGETRSNPYPKDAVAHVPGWDVQVVEVKRGEEAWSAIHAANMFNEPPPEGMEYLLVKIHVVSTATDDETHSISGCDFKITGERNILYSCDAASVVEPDPQLDAELYAGGESEGWAAYAIGKDEHNLLLVVDPLFNFDEEAIRYIALEDGASVSMPADVLSIEPNDLGKSRREPANLSDTIITEEWQVRVTEVIRGDDAWQMVKSANQFNEPPAEGMEYVAVKVYVRYLGKEDKAAGIDGSYFSLSGAKGVEYEAPSVVDPEPALDVHLYPGGEYEGWVVLQCAQGETGLILKFEPLFDLSGRNRRFISLGE